MSADDPVPFDCPRCGTPARDHTYGPCEVCRTQLRAAMRRDAADLGVQEYEPKMNVVPNQVATKD